MQHADIIDINTDADADTNSGIAAYTLLRAAMCPADRSMPKMTAYALAREATKLDDGRKVVERVVVGSK